MPVRDLSAFFDESLKYPDIPWRRREDPADPESPMIEGKTTYSVKSPDAKTGLYLSSIARIGVNAAAGVPIVDADLAKIKLDDDGERNLYQTVLGTTYDDMLRDGVDWTMLQHIGQDAYLTFALNEETAAAALALAVARVGEAPARPANRAQRRATRTPQKKAGSKSNRASTATRARTPSPTSTRSSKSSTEAAG